MSEIIPPHLANARFHYSRSWSEAADRRPISSVDEPSQRVIADIARVARRLSEVQHDETGLNLPRITQFLGRYGLTATPFVGVDEAGQKSINKIFDGDDSDTSGVLVTGSHLTLPGFTYVLRGQREAHSGTDAVEATAVHELTHADHAYLDILVARNDERRIGHSYAMLRSGFMTYDPVTGTKAGSLFSEGRAELVAQHYIVDGLGMQNGFMDRAEPFKVTIDKDHSYWIPGSYVFEAQQTGLPRTRVTTHAAFALALLIAKDPSLFPAMLEAPKNLEALAEFTGRVESLDQGMFENLQRYSYSQQDFMSATAYVIDRLYDGDASKALSSLIE